MEFMEPPYHHYSHHHEQIPAGLSPYFEAHAMHNYSMAQQQSAVMQTINGLPKTETKPRLGKEEVEILEVEFKKNPKPTTQTKKLFAEQMGVDLPRINNWFQNRRAKRKQEKKQEAYEAGQTQELQEISEPSSPDNYIGSEYTQSTIVPIRSATFPMANGQLQAVAPYNPQYTNPSSASMESLQRTIVAAQAGQNLHQNYGGAFLNGSEMSSFGGPLIQDSSRNDRAQFPSLNTMSTFDNNDYSFPSMLTSGLYQPPQSIPEFHHSPEESSETPTQFNTHTSSEAETLMNAFPSQLLPPQESNRSNDYSESPEDSGASSSGFNPKWEIQNSDESSLVPPPASSLSFAGSSRPMDIASRRKKVQVKPAALVADITRGRRPGLGPRTVSHAEGFRRPIGSPMASPRRPRIVSAGGNRNGMSGRIQKPVFDMAQRSPINPNGFTDMTMFLDHSYSKFRQPSVTGSSSMSSSLDPPTPLSPNEQAMGFKMENAYTPGYESNGDNLASPPETPLIMGGNFASSGWPSAVDYSEDHYHYDVADEPLYTSAQDSFLLEDRMQQPMSQSTSYLNVASQPVTPAFGQFNPNFTFGHDSPQLRAESPQYALSTQNHVEYSFPEAPQFSMGLMVPPPAKKFQFSHSTPADFSGK